LLKKAGEPAVEDFEGDESDANPAQLFE
jgi:hypothetical protein